MVILFFSTFRRDISCNVSLREELSTADVALTKAVTGGTAVLEFNSRQAIYTATFPHLSISITGEYTLENGIWKKKANKYFKKRFLIFEVTCKGSTLFSQHFPIEVRPSEIRT